MTAALNDIVLTKFLALIGANAALTGFIFRTNLNYLVQILFSTFRLSNEPLVII